MESKKPSTVVLKVIPPGCPLGKRFTSDNYTDSVMYERIEGVRAMIFRRFPFWGTYALSMIYVEDSTKTISTCGTDGRHIFYNAEWMRRLFENGSSNRGPFYVLFVIAHEIYHCLGRHVAYNGWYRGRDNDRDGDPIDQDLFNRACDYYINNSLIEGQIGDFPSHVGGLRSVLLPAEIHEVKYANYVNPFAGMTCEEIYMWLKKNPDENPNLGGGGSLDTHLEVKSGAEDGAEITDGKITITLANVEELDAEMVRLTHQGATIQHEIEQAQKSKGVGSLPIGVQRIIDDLVKPKVDWKSALWRFCRTIRTRGYSLLKPNKSFFQQGITIPGFRRTRVEIDMVLMIDGSGSVSIRELTRYLSEQMGIMQAFPHFTMLAWVFDGEVLEDSVQLLTSKNTDRSNELLKFVKKLKGGGGTSFQANWDYMRAKQIRPRVAIMMTDGGTCDTWGDPTWCPMLWLVTGKATPPYGVHIHYELN